MATQAGIPFSKAQLLNKELQIIKNTRGFEIALTAWNFKPDIKKTWANFKIHFQEAQQALKEVRGPTMQQSGYHHANSLESQLRTELQIRDTDLLSMVQNIRENTTEMDTPSLTNTSTSATSTKTESLNIATQQSTQLQILKLLRDLQSEVRGNNTERGSYSGGRSAGGRGSRNEN